MEHEPGLIIYSKLVPYVFNETVLFMYPFLVKVVWYVEAFLPLVDCLSPRDSPINRESLCHFHILFQYV